MNAKNEIIQAQKKWYNEDKDKTPLVGPTTQSCKDKEKTYCADLESNLFNNQLNEDTFSEFAKGNGNELYSPRPKMQALHSSSALAVNFFDFWRNRKDKKFLLEALLSACKDTTNNRDLIGQIKSIDTIEFEKQLATGNGAAKANIDVYLTCKREDNTNIIIAIESKFTEIYDSHNPLPKSYLDENLLDDIKDIANNLKTYNRLDAPQLIKHILGLRNTSDNTNDFLLITIWYDDPKFEESQQNKNMKSQLNDFCTSISDKANFAHTTYQDVFKEFKEKDLGNSSEYRDYYTYLKHRYFK